MKKLKIAIIAPLTESVPPQKYGGTELVVSNLVEELVKRGHKVTLFAAGRSRTRAKLLKISPYPLRYEGIGLKLAYNLLLTDKLCQHEKNFDIIHNHAGWLLLFFSQFFQKAKFLTTLHGRLDTKQSQLVLSRFKNLNYISVSLSQRKHFPSLNYLANIYHGIDITKYQFNAIPKDYLIFLGRISPEKGIEKAITIAKRSKMKLKIAAKIDPADKNFWFKKVKPQIDNKNIIYVGEVKHAKKVHFLKNALALINPISWPEPFGLAMIEALACGTPVIAPKKASIPEIINSKVGFVVDPKNLIMDSIRAINNVSKIDRRKCREYVEKKFTVEKMVDAYEKVYYKLKT